MNVKNMEKKKNKLIQISLYPFNIYNIDNENNIKYF